MRTPDKLIRRGLWLVPWLPALLLAIWVHAAFFTPRFHVPPGMLVYYSYGSISYVRVVPSAHDPSPFFRALPTLTVRLSVLCALCAFLAGCALLFTGFLRRSKLSSSSRAQHLTTRSSEPPLRSGR